LPSILRKAKELSVLVDGAEQPENNLLWKKLEWLWDEQFIETAGDAALSRWEKMMNLPPASSIEERREAILRRLREATIFTLKQLRALLEELCGPGRFTVEMNYGKYRLIVRITPDSPAATVESVLARRIPANILLDMGFYYVRHNDLTPFRHRELASNTHLRIREDA
jgi:hypothetical protein